MRTRIVSLASYQAGDRQPSLRVRFDDVPFDPGAPPDAITFELVTWFGEVVAKSGAAAVDGPVTPKTDAATGATFYGFTLVYQWAADDLETAGPYFGRFKVDAAALSGLATIPPGREILLEVRPVREEPEP